MEETPKGGAIVARAAKIAAESGQPVEQVTRALMETTDVWKGFVEAQAENEKLRAERDYANGCLRASSHNEIQYGAQLDRVCRERDALQSRLDAMTVEWAYKDDMSGSVYPNRDNRQLPNLPGVSVQTRLVGPWTVVPEGDGNV